jgi:hypothetical protein
MLKLFVILLLPIALAACEVGHVKVPMTLGPSDTAQAACLTYGDTPAYGCKAPGEVTIPQDPK